jgi:hypothetical protein
MSCYAYARADWVIKQDNSILDYDEGVGNVR